MATPSPTDIFWSQCLTGDSPRVTEVFEAPVASLVTSPTAHPNREGGPRSTCCWQGTARGSHANDAAAGSNSTPGHAPHHSRAARRLADDETPLGHTRIDDTGDGLNCAGTARGEEPGSPVSNYTQSRNTRVRRAHIVQSELGDDLCLGGGPRDRHPMALQKRGDRVGRLDLLRAPLRHLDRARRCRTDHVRGRELTEGHRVTQTTAFVRHSKTLSRVSATERRRAQAQPQCVRWRQGHGRPDRGDQGNVALLGGQGFRQMDWPTTPIDEFTRVGREVHADNLRHRKAPQRHDGDRCDPNGHARVGREVEGDIGNLGGSREEADAGLAGASATGERDGCPVASCRHNSDNCCHDEHDGGRGPQRDPEPTLVGESRHNAVRDDVTRPRNGDRSLSQLNFEMSAYSDGCCTPVPIGPVQRFRRSCTAARG